MIPYRDEAHAIELANGTRYGLNASVFTNDESRAAARLARSLRSGTVAYNAHRGAADVAFGGFKQSGIGREGGREGLYPYLETKTIITDRAATDTDGEGERGLIAERLSRDRKLSGRCARGYWPGPHRSDRACPPPPA